MGSRWGMTVRVTMLGVTSLRLGFVMCLAPEGAVTVRTMRFLKQLVNENARHLVNHFDSEAVSARLAIKSASGGWTHELRHGRVSARHAFWIRRV